MSKQSIFKTKQPNKCLRCGGQLVDSGYDDDDNCLQCGALYTKDGKLSAYLMPESIINVIRLPAWLRN